MRTTQMDGKSNYNSFTMNNPLGVEKFKRQGHMIVNFFADYFDNVRNYPVLSQVKPKYLEKQGPSLAPIGPVY
ncbi:hypothetical protein AAHE18_13G170500 [Arachis hypogaea]